MVVDKWNTLAQSDRRIALKNASGRRTEGSACRVLACLKLTQGMLPQERVRNGTPAAKAALGFRADGMGQQGRLTWQWHCC